MANIAYKYLFKPPLLFPFSTSIIFLIIFPSTTYSISEGEALLEFKKSLVNSEALHSWETNMAADPCQDKNKQWDGVMCYEGIVTGINLHSMGLSGIINIDALSNLQGLRFVSLEGNQFTGPIPEFNRLGSLKALYLTNNQFSGQIPQDYFSTMDSLKKLWLSNNKFSGEIPLSLLELRHLIELHLDNNQFSGVVPPLKQPPLVSLDVSNNQLKGEIPSSLSNFDASSFGGNPNLCGGIVRRDCNHVVIKTPKEPKSEPNNKSKTKVVAACITLSVVVISLLIVLFCMSKKKKKDHNLDMPTTTPSHIHTTANTTPRSKKVMENIDDGVVEVDVGPTLSRKDSKSSSKRSTSSHKSSGKGGASGSAGGVADLTMVNDENGVFGLADLMKASAEVLGNGGMGSAYKALMANGFAVAVKRMRELNRLENDAFDEEIRRLASLRHENILTPLAYHYRKEEKLVVYEYVAKGSLQYLLHGDRGRSHAELNWPTRLNIIKGVTEGLHYLHCELDTYDLPHGNLKSSNILINSENKPLLSDYGFSMMANPNIATNALFAYKSPEAIQNQEVSPKSDIYCLGIVILEILTGKFPCQYLTNTKNGTDVIQWAVSAIDEGRESGLLDPNMMSNSTSCDDSMVELLHIGAACTQPNPNKRPSLIEIIEMIERLELQGDNNAGGGQDNRTVEFLPSLRDGIC